jgi:hypothetical protein
MFCQVKQKENDFLVLQTFDKVNTICYYRRDRARLLPIRLLPIPVQSIYTNTGQSYTGAGQSYTGAGQSYTEEKQPNK